MILHARNLGKAYLNFDLYGINWSNLVIFRQWLCWYWGSEVTCFLCLVPRWERLVKRKLAGIGYLMNLFSIIILDFHGGGTINFGESLKCPHYCLRYSKEIQKEKNRNIWLLPFPIFIFSCMCFVSIQEEITQHARSVGTFYMVLKSKDLT